MFWFIILILSFAAWICSNLYALATNYLKARKSGFPLVICPVNQTQVIWMITSVPLRSFFKRILPASLFRRLNLAIYGWESTEKFSPFAKYGRNFMLVTCGTNELNIAEPELAIEALKRPKDFAQNEIASYMMGLFGENLVTSSGESWSRQRKLIAPNINERISKAVFQESCRQTTQMMDHYANNSGGVTDEALLGLKTIAINVLAAAVYGISWPWNQHKQAVQPGYRMTYIEATRVVVDNIVQATFIPAKLLLLPFMPSSLQDVGHAIREFPLHTKQMLDSEHKRSLEDSNGMTNMMSILVNESVQGTEDKQGGILEGTQKLSHSEIVGNLFLFTAAGFDTTANTMAYAVTLLATYPEWQKWLFAELDEVLRGKGEEVECFEIFPKLTRCLALMYETLRLFTPLVHLAKMTLGETTVTGSDKTYHIPPKTTVHINCAVHTDPKTWGGDALDFRPSRWLTTNPETGRPSLISPRKGTFIPWSAGPRACPGSKMSQVEFVSVFMTIFRKYRVEAVPKNDQETQDQCRERLIGLMNDSQPRTTQQMNKPKEVKLRWIRRHA